MIQSAIAILTGTLIGFSAQAATTQYISFTGKASIEAVQSGKLTQTVRLGDRTQVPFSFKLGLVLPLVNGDKVEDTRTFEDQIAANAYGKVELTLVSVSQFESLSAADKAEFLKHYSPEKIKEAKGVVTKLGLKVK